jgi:hypothetical protein
MLAAIVRASDGQYQIEMFYKRGSQEETPPRFHRFFATKPVSSETSKAERRLRGDHGSI